MFPLAQLQSVKNTLAFTVTNHRKYTHFTPIFLKWLHWLPVNYCCIFKSARLVYKFYTVPPLTILDHPCL